MVSVGVVVVVVGATVIEVAILGVVVIACLVALVELVGCIVSLAQSDHEGHISEIGTVAAP